MLRQPILTASSRQGLELSFKLNILRQSCVQQMYQDICRLVTLAYLSAEASLIIHVGREAFIVARNDSKLQLEVMKQEP